MTKIIKNPTLFVDIDGTIIKYRKFSELEESTPEPIQDVIDYINGHHSNGAIIIITTARPEKYRLFTEDELTTIGLKWNQLVMDCGRGTRVVLNDIDPKSPEIKRAVGINLVRNGGLTNIEIPLDIKPYESE
jgi:hypothetical protein